LWRINFFLGRSAIVALSLLGKLALMQGMVEKGIKNCIQAAVQYLEKMGAMPLVTWKRYF
jgi:hypothetical protein